MALTVRFPKIDYSRIPAHWAPNIAFAQFNNATSLIPTPVEPWLIKVLQGAMAKKPISDESLRADVIGFIGQESQHYRQHRLFNKMMIERGYPKLAEFERQLALDLDGFLKNRTLKFLLAYADGFESLGAVAGGVWFEKSDSMLKNADSNAVALWKWHMAEEFEHREVCFKVYHELFGQGFWNSIVNGYFYRIYGFIFAMIHLQGYGQRMYDYMLDVDRSSMTPAEALKLKYDMKMLKGFQRKYTLPQLLKNFLPWYDPGRKRTPVGVQQYLKRFEPGGDLARGAQPVDP